MTGEVVLVVAPPGDADVLDAPTFLGRMPNVGILYLASALEKAGYPTLALDRHYDPVTPFQLAADIVARAPRLVGFSLFDLTMDFTRQTLSILSALYRGPIVVGGYTATFHAEDLLGEWPWVDAVFLNEAEESLVAYLRHLDGETGIEEVPGIVLRDPEKPGEVLRAAAARSPDVTALPWPQRHWDNDEDVTPIVTRRGCTSACSFCSMVPFYDRESAPIVRYREVTDVVDELADCLKNGRTEFMFYDDDFGLATRRDREWADAFCDEVAVRGLRFQFGVELRVIDMIRGVEQIPRLRRAGLSHIAIGMESLLPRQLSLLNKGYKQHQVLQAIEVADTAGIFYQTNVIFWDPFITLKEAAEHLRLLDRINIQDQLSSANYPFYAGTLTARKGTRLHRELVERGLLTPSRHAFYRYSYDFADSGTRDFHALILPDFLDRTRRVIRRPSALWMLVPRLEFHGHTALADQLKQAGRRLAREEFLYFQRLIDLSLEHGAADPRKTPFRDLHDEMAVRLSAASSDFPELDRKLLDDVDCAVVVPENMLPGGAAAVARAG